MTGGTLFFYLQEAREVERRLRGIDVVLQREGDINLRLACGAARIACVELRERLATAYNRAERAGRRS